MAEKPARQPIPRGFWVIWTTVAVDLIGFGIVLPILPQYAERFGAGAAVIGLLSASFSLAQLVFAPVWGKLSDRIGRKPIIIISLFGTAIGSLVTGFAGALHVGTDGGRGCGCASVRFSKLPIVRPYRSRISTIAPRPTAEGLHRAQF